MRWAIEHGRAEAARNLAQCYERGEEVDMDLAAAIHWYRVAAAMGDAAARKTLLDLRRRKPAESDFD
jgi:TPR repeat protein